MDVSGPVRVAVVIPCYNEANSIGKVVTDFKHCLPGATIYVYDNNSADKTVSTARNAGAIVRQEKLQGKGHVVRRMFADVDADIYVLVDGDDTYDASTAPEMVRMLVDEGLDMVTAARVTRIQSAYRAGHRFGNRVLTGMVAIVFGNQITDMLSGYRAFSRRFVKSFPALALGFEIETEFSVHALDLHMPVGEIKTCYRERPAGSHSKLRTVPDGLRILRTILMLVKDERPLQFFSVAGLLLFILSIALGVPVVLEFLKTGLVPRLPTAVLATGLSLLASLSLAVGLILDTVARGRKEAKRLVYLATPGTAESLKGADMEADRQKNGISPHFPVNHRQ